MSGDLRCTDFDLHRFIDGELDAEASSRIQALLEQDSSLRARVCEYRSVDQAVREAFRQVTPPAGHGANTIKRLKEQGVDVLLIDRTHARETAIDHVVERLRDGWTYIKI